MKIQPGGILSAQTHCASMANVPAHLSKEGEGRFVERVKAALLSVLADPHSTLVPPEVHIVDVRRPSFLLQGGCLVQAEAEFPYMRSVFWCLFFDGETDAILVPFLDREVRIADIIASIEQERPNCVLIDANTIGNYVEESLNYELAGVALLISDLDPKSRTFGVLDWPTPLLESEKVEVKACLEKHILQFRPDTSYSLKFEACMVEGDALVLREFRVFTKAKEDSLYDGGKKGEIKAGKRKAQVLVKGLPDNCRPKPGASLGTPEIRSTADPEGWELIFPRDASSIASDLNRRVKALLDPTQLGRFSRQYLPFYALDLLKIEPATSDDTEIAYILWKPGFALPLDATSEPIHRLNMILAEERSKSGNGRIIREPEDAAGYTVFFGRHVYGSEGPFVVLKNRDDTAIAQVDWTRAELTTDRFVSIDAALAAIAPPRAMESSSDSAAFEVTAWVLYGSAIFQSAFRVRADGSIEMTHDDEVLSRIQVNPRPPYRRLDSFSEPVHFKPLAAAELDEKYGPSTVVEECILTGQLTRETLHVRTFRDCRFRGRVNLQLLVADHGLTFKQCVFENGLDLTGASLKGRVSIAKCLLVHGRHHELIDDAQPFSLNDVSANCLQIDDLCSTSTLSASGVRASGAVQLLRTRTLGRMDLAGLAARSLEFQDSRAKEGIELRNSVVSWDVDLSGVQCPAGGINLEDAEIQRDLRIKRRDSLGTAAAKHLTMTGLKCHGTADITGVELFGDPSAGNSNGAVIANLATFAKKLIVADSLDASAKIPGRLDLSGSIIGDLVLSVSWFNEDPTNENLMRYGIFLNQAQVNKFSAFRNKKQAPRPIDLRFSEVKWWEFRDGDKADSDASEDYIELLAGDPNRQRHTYSSIERNLFNRGHDKAADEVHKAMRKWLRGQGKGKVDRWFTNPRRWAWDLLTDSTTSSVRLVCIVAIWLVISTGLFSNPANIGPSAQGLAANREWRADRVPPDTEWGVVSGLWTALRYHVPVAVFTARAEWEPTNARELKVVDRSWSWINPEDYANVVLAVHWFIWPVILIIWSRKMFRRLDK